MAAYVREAMRERGIKGSFWLGGITEFFVDMMKEGLFERLWTSSPSTRRGEVHRREPQPR